MSMGIDIVQSLLCSLSFSLSSLQLLVCSVDVSSHSLLISISLRESLSVSTFYNNKIKLINKIKIIISYLLWLFSSVETSCRIRYPLKIIKIILIIILMELDCKFILTGGFYLMNR